MENGYTFCEECNKKIKFNVNKEYIVSKIHGKECKFEGYKCSCPECNSEVYVAEYEDTNLDLLKNAYREENGVLNELQLNEMLERYDIGKRPFSIVIGLGELTYTKYLEGNIPTRSNADLLNRLYFNPELYKELLIKNKTLICDVAFQKSISAVNNYITDNSSKLKTIAAYIISQCEDITQLMLQKMLYYFQALYWVYHQRFLFVEDCEAWVHGPVYRDIYEKYKNYHYDSLNDSLMIKPIITTDEKLIADTVIKYFGCYSGKVLEKFTHMELPWVKTREGLPENERSDRVIEKDLLITYFSENIGLDNNKFVEHVEAYANKLFELVKSC